MRPDEEPWPHRAACRGTSTALFFPIANRYGAEHHDPVMLAAARAVCDRCEVREECLDKALDMGVNTYGVWGGTTKPEREALLRHIRRARCPVCGGEHLRANATHQWCLACGRSWTTARPSQTRLNGDAVA